MAAFTLDGLWPTHEAPARGGIWKTLAGFLVKSQERRAKASVRQVLRGYDYDYDSLHRMGMADEDIRRLLCSRIEGGR